MRKAKQKKQFRAVWIDPDRHERLSRQAKEERYSMSALACEALDRLYWSRRDATKLLGGFSRADVKELTEAK